MSTETETTRPIEPVHPIETIAETGLEPHRMPPPEQPKPVATPVPRPVPAARRLVGSLLLAALFLLGFVVYLYGLSGVSEDRTQNTLYKSFAANLISATAPTGSAPEGSPVAVLSIPAIGLTDLVVVEGTSGRDLENGPGHVIASALPGQAGASFLYGKSATFGAPFQHLMRLNRGDVITVVTGEGTSRYRVSSFGDSTVPAPDTTPNRLVLMSGNAATVPNKAVQVAADLITAPQVNPGNRPAVPSNQQILGGDAIEVLLPLFLWSQGLLLASIGGALMARYWARWPTYLCMTPVVIALTWHIYANAAALLPNVY
ncbi:MAG TPA: sortase [Pseudonocardiaceae bacterium]|jgi:sortase (surface protein transpeptidase)